MDKLLLTLTLLAFSSGVLCNVAQNLTDGGRAADSELPRTEVLGDDVEYYNQLKCLNNVPDGYMNISNIALKLYEQPAVTWNQARQLCAAAGGQLAIINSSGEALWMLLWLKQTHVAEAWIGIHDHFERGHWVTLTGESLATAGYEIWLPNEPSYPDGNEDCGSLSLIGDSKNSYGFKNLACDHWRSYFCKIKLC